MSIYSLITIGLVGITLSSCQSTMTPQAADGTGHMYMANHTMFAFKPGTPDGWVYGRDAGAAGGNVHATFHPKGASFQKSQQVMYIQSQEFSNEVKTLEDPPKLVIRSFRDEGHKNFAGKKVKTITTRNGISVPIWEFRGDNFGNVEASGYMMGDREILSVVLSARNEKSYHEAYSSFEYLIKSYGGTISQSQL
jgi:hypothetical protein